MENKENQIDWIKYKYLTNKVKAHANLKGMSLKDISEKMGMPRSTLYHKLKDGLEKWNKDQLKKLTTLLNCRVEDLVYKETYIDLAVNNEYFDKIINDIATVKCAFCGLEGLPQTCVMEDFEWFHHPRCYKKYLDKK